nr:uncharacterized protein LOC105861066 [Microcebus murinus]XP_012601766.1 uncharacterized protein LOC105861066 [Microcebus murinus]
MAGLRRGRPHCIRAAFGTAGARAGFQRRRRNTRCHFKVNHKKDLMDFAEGIWRELLDPYDGESEDRRHSHHGFSDCPLGDVSWNIALYTLKSKSPGDIHLEDSLSSKIPDLVMKAASWVPEPLASSDVDMQPEDLRATEEDRAPEPPLAPASPPGRQGPGRARGPRPSPRLGSERDRGPKLSFSKRKLELLLAEPEKNKRKKQFVA